MMLQTPFDAFCSRYHSFATRCPNARLFMGLEQDLGELPDPSLRAAEAELEEAEELLRELEPLDRAGLSFDERMDLDIARMLLQRSAHAHRLRFNGSSTLEQSPEVSGPLGDGLFLLFISDPRPAEERLEDITARLERAPDFIQASLERLDRPVKRWLEMDLRSVQELGELFDTLEGWAESIGWADRPRLKRASAATRQALSRYEEALGSLETVEHFAIGRDEAEAIVRHRGLDLSLEELHQVATDFTRRNQEQVEALRQKLCRRYSLAPDCSAAELQKELSQRFKLDLQGGGLEAVLNHYQQEREKILQFIQERDLFPLFEEQELRILRTPSFMAPTIPAGAMMPPPPFRDGVLTSLVYLTLSEELLDEHTLLSIPAMMIHEGIPGHHLQLAWAARQSSVIRRHCDAMEHCEGWTTMLEDYMLDQGYAGELADEVRFVTQRDIARIGARVGIDLYFMTGEEQFLEIGVDYDRSSQDPFVRAGSLLTEVTGFVPARTQAELNWYSKERGYPLSYLAGNHLVWKLKGDLEREAGGPSAELDRRFHSVYLRSGNMPLSYLRRVFQHEGMLSAD